jgi:hypothetical protein
MNTPTTERSWRPDVRAALAALAVAAAIAAPALAIAEATTHPVTTTVTAKGGSGSRDGLGGCGNHNEAAAVDDGQ